jgi:hypothetical protein
LLGCGSGWEKYYITEVVISHPCDNYCLCWGPPSKADSPLVGEDLLGGDLGFRKGKVKYAKVSWPIETKRGSSTTVMGQLICPSSQKISRHSAVWWMEE